LILKGISVVHDKGKSLFYEVVIQEKCFSSARLYWDFMGVSLMPYLTKFMNCHSAEIREYSVYC
jgi:hypothetical protein